MKFQFLEGDDVAKYVTIDENGKEQIETDSFRFMGFSNNIHPFFQKQIDFAVKALKSKGIFLNVTTVATVNQISEDIDKGYLDDEDVKVPSNLQKSEDGNFYCLLRDKEMGRGWAVLYKVENGKTKIITQEHRGIVRDEIMKGDFIRSFGVQYVQPYDSELLVS